MADRKITDLTALTTPASADVLPIVDVSEAAAADKNKKITIGELFKGVPDGTAAAPAIAFTGSGTDTGFYSPGADQVAISTGGTGRLFVDASGNVGVGLSSPGSEVHVFSANPEVRLQSSGTSTTCEYSMLGRDASNVAHKVNIKTSGSALTFGTGGASGNSYVPIERLRITSDGKLGLGTSSVTHALTVTTSGTDAVKINTADYGFIDLSNGTSTLRLQNNGSIPRIGTATNHPLVFSPNEVERMRLDTSGRLGVGTTSPARGPLHINSSTVDTYFHVTNSTTGSSASDGFTLHQSGNETLLNNRESGNMRFYTAGTERMRIDSSGRLGIGVSSPSKLLHLRSSTDISGTGVYDEILRLDNTSGRGSDSGIGISFYQDTNERSRIAAEYDGSGQGLQFHTRQDGQSLSEKVRITSTGNVGIGSTPDVRLHVADTASGSGTYVAEFENLGTGANTEARLLLRTQAGSDNTDCYIGSLGSSANNSNLTFATEASGTLSEKVRITSSGQLLVGTTSASSAGNSQYTYIQVQGGPSGSAWGGIALRRNEPATSITSGEAIGQVIYADSTGNDFARIECFADADANTGDYPGRLVFSTTADGASSPTERMRIAQDGRTDLFASNASTNYIFATNQAANTNNLILGRHSSTGYGTGTSCISIRNNGDVLNTNNSYGAISDIKLKENIANANSQWDDLKAIQIRKYNFKEETGHQTHTQLGVVAQEVELVSPGLVSESPDRDAEGNDLGTVTKSVNYSVLYMKAVKALQEAMERIEVLEARLDAANL